MYFSHYPPFCVKLILFTGKLWKIYGIPVCTSTGTKDIIRRG
ncbi:hypothetical protein RO1_31830 [Roseburia intestinalis XB6B4]|jgi:hypothetical protein|uniref:Uncharacterized protein n=1 Tax=Roseburia intestinalis XB6B4 TaxID=718255 RepID=D4L1M3_9FIRM|nr:hypothetical protein RO1_31830 [Roseburia intestinalis XB6B4]